MERHKHPLHAIAHLDSRRDTPGFPPSSQFCGADLGDDTSHPSPIKPDPPGTNASPVSYFYAATFHGATTLTYCLPGL